MARSKGTTAEETERMRNLLAFFLVGAFISTVPLFTFKTFPEANKDIIVYIVGQLSGMALMALGYYFVNKVGQDALDEKRTENTGKMADAVIAAANSSGTGSSTGSVTQAAEEVAGAASDKAQEIKDNQP